MPYVLRTRSASAPTSSSITFSDDRGPGAHSPLHGLPRRKTAKKSLFHIHNDDPSPPPSPLPTTPPDDPPESPPDPPESPPDPPDPPPNPTSVPFPRSSPTELTRTSSASSVILPNGKPLKSSLKSSSSTSIPDDLPSRHARSQSMPSTPAFGPKNVHFKEKDEGLETVRVFRRTGRPVAVSTPQGDDTETETEAEHFPFPLMSSSSPPPLMEIDPDPARTSSIPTPHPAPDMNLHLESISLPPARPPVLRGTVLVRNLAFEKHVGVRFTLDDWTTVSEVLGTYAGPVAEHEALAGFARNMTVGDLVGILSSTSISKPAPKQDWDRFTFTIRLEDYEPRLGERTLWLVARFAAPGLGEWWDNNGGANYRVGFRPRAPLSPPRATPAATFAPTQPPRPRGASAPAAHPSAAPFMMSMTPPTPQHPHRGPHYPHGFAHAPRRTSPPPSPPPLQSPSPRLHLRHYAAPARAVHVTPPAPCDGMAGSPPLRASVIIGGQPATRTDSEDEREREEARPALQLTLSSPPSPTIADAEDAPLRSTLEDKRDSVLSPLAGMGRMPFGSAPVPEVGPSDSSYAAFLREWCFAQDPSTRAGPVLGADLGRGGRMGWVGGI